MKSQGYYGKAINQKESLFSNNNNKNSNNSNSTNNNSNSNSNNNDNGNNLNKINIAVKREYGKVIEIPKDKVNIESNNLKKLSSEPSIDKKNIKIEEVKKEKDVKDRKSVENREVKSDIKDINDFMNRKMDQKK